MFAMKTMQKQIILENELQEYVFTEKKIMTQIDHPFIIKAHFVFQSPNSIFIVMDFLPGRDLSYYIQKNNRKMLSVKNIKIILCEVILALEELHRNKIIFRDLKPENILIDCSGHIKLIDFGLAK